MQRISGPRIWILAAVGLLSNACAFTPIPLTLPTTGLANTVKGGKGRQVIVVVPFSDRRGEMRCGMQKNSYNAETAPAECQMDPNQWLAQLLADELRASGFTVLSKDDEHRPGALRIEGDLQKLFVEPVIGAWTISLEADLSVTLKASTDTGLEATRKFFVKGWKGGQMASTMQPYHTAMHRATQLLLEEMVWSIIELMDLYPQLGAEHGPAYGWVVTRERVRS